MLGAPHELDAIISEFPIHGVRTDRVVIAGEEEFLSPAVLQEIKRTCRRRQVDLSFLPRMIGVTAQKPSNVAARFEPVQERPAFAPPSFFRLKRWIDIVGSLALIVLFFPVLMLGGVLVFLDVGRPILFGRSDLVGRDALFWFTNFAP